MADLIRKMQEGHTVEDLDTVIDEVYEARGEYDSLGERLDDMEGGAPTPSTSIPAMDGTGSAGTSSQYARADHVHPSDTSKQNALSSTQLDAVNSGINSTKVGQIETNKNNISSLNKIGGKTYEIALSSLTFTTTSSGLYESNTIDVSSDFTRLFAITMIGFSACPNVSFNYLIKDNNGIRVIVCDPTAPSTLTFGATSKIWILAYGWKV